MRSPLVSVIIPTAKRPHYLPRAIDSALSGMLPGEAEVIVVPNGPDESWKESLLTYRNNPSIVIVHIAEANANIARNAGLSVARGNFIRFLDDDDYLIPEGAKLQYKLMETNKFDIVCGAIEKRDQHNKCLGKYPSHLFDDFCEAVASPEIYYLTHAPIFRSDLKNEILWDENDQYFHEHLWLINLCKSREIKWSWVDDTVGVWQHHSNTRISIINEIQGPNKEISQALLSLFDVLQKNQRLNERRRRAIVEGLWSCIHRAFPLSPHYWSKIARSAMIIDPQARPIQPLYNWPIIQNINPLIIQWILFPWTGFVHLRRYFKKPFNKLH